MRDMTQTKIVDRPHSEAHKVRRTLSHRCLERMRIPRRFRKARFSRVSEGECKKTIQRYISKMSEVIRRGYGLLIWGKNDTGKTSVASIVAMEARRMGHTVLFLRVNEYLTGTVNGAVFNDAMTLAERSRSVDLLVLDDLGKEQVNLNGTGAISGLAIIEDLLRDRYGAEKSTIITTNMPPDVLEKHYGPSFIGVLKDSTTVVKLAGPSQRDIEKEEMVSFMKG